MRAWPFRLDKWYADVMLDDGGLVVVWIARMLLLGVPMTRVTVELHDAEGNERRVRASRRVGRWEPGTPDGPAGVSGFRLRWKTRSFAGDLAYAPRHRHVEPARPLLALDGRSLRWSVAIPDADVRGELRLDAVSRSVTGRGYVDRVRTDLLPWRFPIRELTWGRAVAERHACFWLEAETTCGPLAVDWADGAVVDAGSARPALGEGRRLRVERMAESPRARFGLLRPVVRRWFGDPWHESWQAPAVIAGESGRAVHERAGWR